MLVVIEVDWVDVLSVGEVDDLGVLFLEAGALVNIHSLEGG